MRLTINMHHWKASNVFRLRHTVGEFEMTNADRKRRINLQRDLAELHVRGAICASKIAAK